MSDLIAKAKAAPGKLTFASPGVGSVSQLAVELWHDLVQLLESVDALRRHDDAHDAPVVGVGSSLDQACGSPGGTTSTCALSISVRPSPLPTGPGSSWLSPAAS